MLYPFKGSWFNKNRHINYAVQGLYSNDYGWETVDLYPTWVDAIRKITRLDFTAPDMEHRIKKLEDKREV